MLKCNFFITQFEGSKSLIKAEFATTCYALLRDNILSVDELKESVSRAEQYNKTGKFEEESELSGDAKEALDRLVDTIVDRILRG